MTSYKLQLRPGGIIPPAINVGIRMKRVPPVVEPVVVAAAAPEVPAVARLPAGADNFADAAQIDITEGRWLDRISENTYVKDFTVEADEPNYYNHATAEEFSILLKRTAWWKFLVPADKEVWIDVDTKLSFGNRATVAVAQANTWLNVYATDAAGPAFVLPDLESIAGNSDVGTGGTPTDGGGVGTGPDSWGTGQYAEVHNVFCQGSFSGNAEGTWFWIQVGDEYDSDNPHAFVLRMSVTDQATDDDLYPKWIVDGKEPDA